MMPSSTEQFFVLSFWRCCSLQRLPAAPSGKFVELRRCIAALVHVESERRGDSVGVSL